MGKLLYLLSLLTQLDPTYQEAGDNVRRALLETPMMKHELVVLEDSSERILYDKTGLTRGDLAYGAYLYPLVVGKFSTKPFKNFKHVTSGHWVFRPEIEYTINSHESTAFLFISKEF